MFYMPICFYYYLTKLIIFTRPNRTSGIFLEEGFKGNYLRGKQLTIYWKTARVIPIFKGKGSKDDPKNYRPISVISHVAKLFEKCVHKQLLSYMNQHAFLSVHQPAYLCNHSTQTLLHQIHDNWLQNMLFVSMT